MRRQRNGTPNPGTRALRRVHDLLRAVIQHAVIVRLEANSDVLVVHRTLLCRGKSKAFFFEKKKQKTFVWLSRD
jgi:hypothetical protein